jgi:hypothetical protein
MSAMGGGEVEKGGQRERGRVGEREIQKDSFCTRSLTKRKHLLWTFGQRNRYKGEKLWQTIKKQ